jgi:hypothetical protein
MRFGALLLCLSTVIGAVATGCSEEFDSCYETHTCPRPVEDGGAAGASGAPGAPDVNEGGGAGRSDVSDAGEGGTSPITGTFEVVSTVPGDEASGVERDSSIEVTFSAPVDADTVTSDTVQLIGPDGPVMGKLDANGSSIVFTPDAALSIFADYELQLSAPLAAVSGDELSRDLRVTFRTREGVFGQPKRLATGSVQSLGAKGTRSGHVVVFWSDAQLPPSKITSFFNPGAGTWTVPTPSEMATEGDYGSGCVALNDKGEAFALLGFDTQPLWNRAKQGLWGSAKPVQAVEAQGCALADDGTAMAIWEAPAGADWSVFAASLSALDEWSAAKTLRSKARTEGLARYGSGFLVVYKVDDGETISVEYDPQQGWLAPKPMVEPAMEYGYRSLATLHPAALMTWNGPGASVHVSSFDGDVWTSAELGPGYGGTTASISSRGRLAAWLNQKSAYIVRGDTNGTWQDPVKLGATNTEDYGPAATIDSSGNALAAWPNGSAIEWRRFLQGSNEWSDIEQIKDQDPLVVLSTIDGAGEVTVVWQNALGVWASRFE